MASSRGGLIELLRKQKRLGRRSLALGIVLFVVAGFCFVQARRFYTSAVHAPGTIVDLERDRIGKDETCFPVFAFMDQAGVSNVIRTSRTRVWSGPRGQYAVGDAIEVLYPAGDPESARINGLFQVWGWPLLFGGGGVLFTVVGVVLWYYAVLYPPDLLAGRRGKPSEPV